MHKTKKKDTGVYVRWRALLATNTRPQFLPRLARSVREREGKKLTLYIQMNKCCIVLVSENKQAKSYLVKFTFNYSIHGDSKMNMLVLFIVSKASSVMTDHCTHRISLPLLLIFTNSVKIKTSINSCIRDTCLKYLIRII